MWKIKCCFILLLLSSHSVLIAQQQMPFMIGVADSNGIVMPFAVYNGETWTNPWPQRDYSGPGSTQPDIVYDKLHEIPKTWHEPLEKIPEGWNILHPDGVTETIHITKLSLAFSYCMLKWALIGEESKKEHVGTMGDFYRLAHDLYLATTAALTGFNMEIPGTQSDEYREIYRIIETSIAISEYTENHPVTDTDRNAVKTELISIVRNKTLQDGGFIYYVEAKKDYKDNRSNPCISYFDGWILKDSNNELSFIRQNFKIYDHEMMYLSPDIPLGILMLDGRSYWIIRNRGYESEEWLILDVSPSGITPILNVYGGGC
ncbi:MAG: hypothetical protein JXB48_03560 [Candidatus Latescibacteria bacterium]|nr:hypothetical protein [Candidatus Latescibacterota bacterium]